MKDGEVIVVKFYNSKRIYELEDLIYEELLEEIIFMDKEFVPSHYMLTDNLSDEDHHRILLINTCETLKAENKNYTLLMNVSKNLDTRQACCKIINWQTELLKLYEDELNRVGLGKYEYDFK